MDQTDQESGGNNHNNNNKSGSNGGGGYTCRQTSTRWTPTTEQIRILKDLYYNNGVRSPTADQIQKISARLRQYGKIEGKNVFYWFQNHKARERQKKRFNGNINMNTTLPSNSSMMTTAAAAAANDHYHNHHHNHLLLHNHHPIQRNVKLDQDHHNRFPTFHNGNNINHVSSGSENGAINASNGYMSSHVYGSMEQDCSMSYNNMNINGGWVNMDHHNHYSSAPYNFFDRPKPLFDSEGQQDDEDVDQTLIYGSDAYLEHRRTLPLFPMHDEDPINGGGKKYGQSDGYDRFRNSYASLELRLSSYAGVAPD